MIAAFTLAGALLVVLGEIYGYGRAATAVVGGWAMLYLGISYFRSAGDAPPDPTPNEVGDGDIRYLCTVCGLELKVEVAVGDRPPTHCREKMKLVEGPPGARPSLHPLP